MKEPLYQFTDRTHPESSGRRAKEGSVAFELLIPLEHRENLKLRIGMGGIVVLMAHLCVIVNNDARLWKEIDLLAEEFARPEGT